MLWDFYFGLYGNVFLFSTASKIWSLSSSCTSILCFCIYHRGSLVIFHWLSSLLSIGPLMCLPSYYSFLASFDFFIVSAFQCKTCCTDTTNQQIKKTDTSSVPYICVNEEEFESMRRRGQFIEWGVFNRARYGTSQSTVRKTVEDGKVCCITLRPDVSFETRFSSYSLHLPNWFNLSSVVTTKGIILESKLFLTP